MDTRQKFGKRLRLLRKQKGLTQEELAGRSERSVEAISNLERGLSLPSLETLEMLAQALDAPIRDFFDFADENERRGHMLSMIMAAARALDDADLYVAVQQVRALRDRPRSKQVPALPD